MMRFGSFRFLKKPSDALHALSETLMKVVPSACNSKPVASHKVDVRDGYNVHRAGAHALVAVLAQG